MHPQSEPAPGTDAILFADDDEELKRDRPGEEPWKILIVDDDIEIHRVTRLVLSPFIFFERPIVLLFARSGPEARAVLGQHQDVAVAILDVVMETDDSGLLLARFIRDQYPNRKTRIILRTGQPGFAPELRVLLDYDINDYRAKAELTAERLLTAVATSLRSYRDIESAEQARAETLAARQANIAKTTFLANMSHELRTPLNAVIGNIELLQMTELTPRQLDLTESAATAAHILLNVVGDVLDLSKIEADRFEIDATEADLSELMTDLAGLFRPQAEKKRLTLSMEVASGLPSRVVTDPVRVRQVLMNFLANAIKFTNAGGVSMRVTAPGTQEATNGALVVRFEVTDTGVGFNPAKSEEIFEPFIQGDGSTTRTYGGSGLGLTIAKRVVELLGGRIGCASVPGQGSTFWCEIPLIAAR